jgi:hypothetical protein
VISDDPPDNTARPSFTGTARVDEFLTLTSYGSWRDPTPTGYSRQWLRCGSSGNGCSDISGATGDSYRLESVDVGHTIRLHVRATGPYGSGQADSNASAVVAARPVPTTPPPPAAPSPPATPPKPRKPRRISPFPRILLVGSVSSTGTLFSQVVVKGPRGVTVRVRCRGGGCPYGSRRYAMRSRKLRLRSLERRFRAGAVIEFRVTRQARIGKYTLIRIRRHRVPGRLDRCLDPGAATPRRCR